jgi:hypothetical protein
MHSYGSTDDLGKLTIKIQQLEMRERVCSWFPLAPRSKFDELDFLVLFFALIISDSSVNSLSQRHKKGEASLVHLSALKGFLRQRLLPLLVPNAQSRFDQLLCMPCVQPADFSVDCHHEAQAATWNIWENH